MGGVNLRYDSMIVAEDTPLRVALSKIDKNQSGAVILIDSKNKVLAIATDGDIRRRLIIDDNLEQPISNCSNADYISVTEADTRETILKHLDARTRILPVINERGELQRVITRDFLRLSDQRQVIARARAPVRISFGGGGTDLTRHFSKHGGYVVNSTIAKYSQATLQRRPDRKICVQSADLNDLLEVDSSEDLPVKGKFGLIGSVLKLIDPDFGFNLEVISDFEPGSGLGGSAAVAAAIIGCFNEFRSDKWDRYELSEIAFQAERLILNVPGGWQDQYATVFGGFNCITFDSNRNEVTPLRLHKDAVFELEASLILCSLGRTRSEPKFDSPKSSAEETLQVAQDLKQAAYQMQRALLRGRVLEFGALLDKAWGMKKKLDAGASCKVVDKFYEEAMRKGALGGKMLGAAGGGYLLLFAPPMSRENVCSKMKEMGLVCERVKFEGDGMQSWKVRVTDDE